MSEYQQSQLSALSQLAAAPSSDAKMIAAFARDRRKAEEIACRYPGTEITVNGAYAFVPKPSLSELLFGFKLL